MFVKNFHFKVPQNILEKLTDIYLTVKLDHLKMKFSFVAILKPVWFRAHKTWVISLNSDI